MIDSLTSSWSRPFKIVRVLQGLGMEVPMRLRRERLASILEVLERNRIEAVLADGSPIDPDDSPGIEAKIRLRLVPGSRIQNTVFGYEVISRLPSGGMSECFKVRGSGGGLWFLKKVPVSGIQAAALRREQDIYVRLEGASAANLLQVYECKRSEDFLGLLMEFADGGTLEEYVESAGSLPPREAKAVDLMVLAGLRELHSLQIVHRDLKPQNVLRCGQQWKLGDFGISKNLARLVQRDITFQRYGTLGYASPEQWEGCAAHPTSDVYAFGKLLVFLLTAQTDVDRLEYASWGRLVRRCTALDPEARPTLDQLETALEGL